MPSNFQRRTAQRRVAARQGKRPVDTGRPPKQIGVQALQLVFQFPLVLDGKNGQAGRGPSDPDWLADRIAATRKSLEAKPWEPVDDVLSYPPGIEPEETDGGAYAQFTYFHDFARKFLFPVGPHAPFTLHERKDVACFDVTIGKTRHRFKPERISLHLFDLGVAIFTFELAWEGKDTPGPLNLAEAQDLLDDLRRNHVPFWSFDTDTKTYNPMRVPTEVVVHAWENDEERKKDRAQDRGNPRFRTRSHVLSTIIAVPNGAALPESGDFFVRRDLPRRP